jgi:hypothetical protein
MAMKLFHGTSAGTARVILSSGFKDGIGNYLTTNEYPGVWLSNVSLDANEGAEGDTLLEVNLDLADEELRPYEWAKEGKPYREWLIPAALFNFKGRVGS